MSAVSEQPYEVEQQPVLLRIVECGPPPEPAGTAPDGWRSAILAGLPVLQPAPNPPAPVSSPLVSVPSSLASASPGLGVPGQAAPATGVPATAGGGLRRGPRLITEAQARGLASSTARAVLDVLAGRRSPRQLTGILDGRTVSAVQIILMGGLRWPVRQPTIGTVHVYLPRRDAVEACVVFRCDQRSRALALRFDRDGRRWLATAIRIG